MSKIVIEVKLSDEDRALLTGVQNAAKAISKAGGVKPGKTPPAPKAEDEDGLDADAGEGDAGEGDEGGEGEDGAGEGEAGGDDDFGADEGDGEPKAATRADVQAALRAYATVSSKADAIKLMKEKGGVDALSKLKDAKFKVVIDAATAAAKKAKKK